MTSGGLVQKTVVACAIFSAAAVGVASLSGHLGLGLGLGAGLMVGSLNGYLIEGLLNRGTPFVAGSLLRLLVLTSIVLVAAFVLRGAAWTVALGIGLAQLVMVAFSVSLRARS